jgi:alkylhydroperoxidase/carboxymuconolactone decarboxylase family protein YurZ
MQQPQPSGFFAVIADTDPRLSDWLTEGREFILSDGALPAKVKALMAMLCDALLAHEDGVKAISDRARAMGASEDEISETIRVAFLMGGLPALSTGANAFMEDSN